MNKISVTLAEATAMTGISRSTFYKLFGAGKLTARKQGKRVLLRVDELDTFINSLPCADIAHGDA